MKLNIEYSRYGVNINVPEGASRMEIVQAYLQTYGGYEGVLDHFLRYASFIEDTIPDANIIEENIENGLKPSS